MLEDGTIEVDFYWPTSRLVVEVDGYGFHRSRRAFREDRRRDRRLAAAGIRTLRFVWEDLDLPDRIGNELAKITRCH
jgi:very-short-patch-repair endonuclease